MISLRWYEFTRTTKQLMIQAMFLSFADYSYHLPVFVLFAKIVFAVVVFVIIIIISKNRFSIRMSLIICKYGVTNVVQRQNKKRKKKCSVRPHFWLVFEFLALFISAQFFGKFNRIFFHSALKVSFSLNEFRVGDIISILAVIFFLVKTVFFVSILRM